MCHIVSGEAAHAVAGHFDENRLWGKMRLRLPGSWTEQSFTTFTIAFFSLQNLDFIIFLEMQHCTIMYIANPPLPIVPSVFHPL